MEKRQRTASQPVKPGIARLLQYAMLRYVIFIATKPELSSSRPLRNAINHHLVPPNWATIPTKKFPVVSSLIWLLFPPYIFALACHDLKIHRHQALIEIDLIALKPGCTRLINLRDGGGWWGRGTEDESTRS
jgi:hypothetical protein